MDLTCEERLSDSPLIERIWRSHSAEGGAFTSMADSHWGMVVSRIQGKTYLTLRGPETRATPAGSPPDAEFVGVQFRPGTLLTTFPARTLMDRRDITLPEASGSRFWLNGSSWQFPDFDNMDTFICRLVSDGLIIHDPLVGDVLRGRHVSLSVRGVQRRILNATGMTYTLIQQIERARQAARLLKQGKSALDVAYELGFTDQAHLIHALRRFTGHTPRQIAAEAARTPLSFLYNTASP